MNGPDAATIAAPSTPESQKGPWATVTVTLGIMLGILLFTYVSLQLVLWKGWTTYKGLDAVSAVAVDGQGQVWVAGYRQNIPSLLIYPETGKPRQVSMPGELTRTAASALMIDNQNRLWVGTENGIVGMRAADNEWILYNSSPEDSIWEMVMDGQGQVWVRSYRGPGRIDPEAGIRDFTFMNSGMADNDAVAIAVDQKGQLWVLTRKRELKLLEPDGTWKTYAIAPDTVRNSIYGSILAFDPQGQIWLATHNGVGVLTPVGAWTDYPLNNSGRPLSMRAILTDAQGRVWVAAALHGLFMFDPRNGWTNYTNRNSGLSGEVNALSLGEEGEVWTGSSQGALRKFDPDAALPVQIQSTVRMAAETLVPIAFLSIALLAICTVAFARPGGTNRKRIVDFSIAFAGWFILNGLLWEYIRNSQAQSGGMLFINPLVLLPLPVNILVMILLYRRQRGMAWGAVSAFLVNWIGLILVRPFDDLFAGSPFWEAILMIPFFFRN